MELPKSDKGHLRESTANIIFNDGRLNAFLLRLQTRQECSLVPLLCNILLLTLVSSIKQEKDTKSLMIEKEVILFTELL